MMTNRAKAIGFGLLLCASSAVLALSSDREQPAVIDADEVEFDFKTGVRTYKGNVSVKQGSLRINAELLKVLFKDGKMETATAWGNPARFQQRPDGKDHDVVGMGKKIELNEPNNTLTLFTQASLKQGADTAHGNKIIWDMESSTLKVKSARIESQPTQSAKPQQPPKRKTRKLGKTDGAPKPKETPPPRARVVIQPKASPEKP